MISFYADINECTNGNVTIGIPLMAGSGSGLSGSGLIVPIPNDWCEQLCVNTPGSYLCDCHDGYIKNTDNQTCTGTVT